MRDILIIVLHRYPTDNDVINTQVIKEAMRHIKLADPPQELHSNHFNIYLAVLPLTFTTSIHLDIYICMILKIEFLTLKGQCVVYEAV